MAHPDIVLISPPFDFTAINSTDGRGSKQAGYYLYYPPIGLCGIAAVLRKSGFSVKILDGQIDSSSEKDLIDRAVAMKPRLFGVSVTTPALPVVFRIVNELKRRAGVPVVVGGPHVSCDPEIVRSMGADYGVVGDGEGPTVKIAGEVLRGQNFIAGAAGIIKKENAEAKLEPSLEDLDSLPFPARDILLNPDSYFNPFKPGRTTMLLTARGCPFHCIFCCRTPSMGAYRPRAIDMALDEMAGVDRDGARFVSIIDESFTFDRERTVSLARGMRERGVKFAWSCQTRADLLDDELAGELARAGCINMSFGLEAGDPEVRDSLDKKIGDAHFDTAMRACRKAGMSVNAFVIIGSPDETAAQIEKSIRRVVQLDPDYAVFNVGTLFPGTREYEKRLAAGEISREVWDKYMMGEGGLPGLSRTMEKEELAELLRRGYSRFYLRPGFAVRRLAGIRSARDLAVLARQARTVVGDYVFRKG